MHVDARAQKTSAPVSRKKAGCFAVSMTFWYRILRVGINESARVSRRYFNGTVPILPYSWYRYHDGEPLGLQLLKSEVDSNLEFVRPFEVASMRGVLMCLLVHCVSFLDTPDTRGSTLLVVDLPASHLRDGAVAVVQSYHHSMLAKE